VGAKVSFGGFKLEAYPDPVHVLVPVEVNPLPIADGQHLQIGQSDFLPVAQ